MNIARLRFFMEFHIFANTVEQSESPNRNLFPVPNVKENLYLLIKIEFLGMADTIEVVEIFVPVISNNFEYCART